MNDINIILLTLIHQQQQISKCIESLENVKRELETLRNQKKQQLIND